MTNYELRITKQVSRDALAERARRALPLSLLLLLLFAAVALAGCAKYRVGYRQIFRPDVQTVYVPMIESDSFRRDLGERLTEAVVKEIQRQSHYRIVNGPDADSILTVRILNDTKRVRAETKYDDPRDIDTSFLAEVSWQGRQGELLARQAAMPLPAGLMRLSETADYIPEGGQSVATAHQEVIERLAKQIVGQMESPW